LRHGKNRNHTTPRIYSAAYSLSNRPTKRNIKHKQKNVTNILNIEHSRKCKYVIDVSGRLYNTNKLCDVKQITELPTRYAVRIAIRNVPQAVTRRTSSDNCLEPKTESSPTDSVAFVPLTVTPFLEGFRIV